MAVTQGDTRRSILDAAQRIMARKGFAAVGINEVLGEAGVPKGSFYHYFGSKDAFGEKLMESYFAERLTDMDRIFAEPGLTSAQRLTNYMQGWLEEQGDDECQGRCLVVKLGAEVSDLSESMRLALKDGTTAIVDRLERAIESGGEEGSLAVTGEARSVAQSLYDMWIGASVLAKIHRDRAPLESAMSVSRQLLHL